ncbi:MAG: chemotaxis protein, partial [Streptococcus orisratti]|nr:chemotaxis protein [Streptococcus orisratti]
KNNIQQISQDLSYKFRVFGKETQAHLDEINRITSKYKQVK